MILPFDVSGLKPDDKFLIALNDGVWLMDDHKWALLAWERHAEEACGKPYTLIHADYHWDGVDDFFDSTTAQESLRDSDLADLEAMIASGEWIRYDSFIAPAVRRGLLAEVHFFCLEDEDNEEGLDEDLCVQFGVRQVLHVSPESLAAVKSDRPIIFDLCLDLFNDSNDQEFEGDLWTDEEVVGFLDEVSHLICSAELVTISLSFGYSGSEDDTRHLAALVVPKILALRSTTTH